MSRIPRQPVTLSLVPVELAADASRTEALALANGRDLFGERVTRWAIVVGLLVALAFVARALWG